MKSSPIEYKGGIQMSESSALPTANKNDQIMAALAHVTVVLPMMGVIAPIVIWATQKDKSEFVAFQALQAVVYQLALILAWFVFMVCYMCSFFGSFILTIPFSSNGGSDGFPFEALAVFIPFLVMIVMMVGWVVYLIYGLVAAFLVLGGRDFRYILIGMWLERYLSTNRTQTNG
jgi:uncharacterized Tic20 family protein